jgi:hypothetical protein
MDRVRGWCGEFKSSLRHSDLMESTIFENIRL